LTAQSEVSRLKAGLAFYTWSGNGFKWRMFPAINIKRSATRKEELMIPDKDLKRI
jgi:hypothetical protein